MKEKVLNRSLIVISKTTVDAGLSCLLVVSFLLAPDGTFYEGRGWMNFSDVKYCFPLGHHVKEGLHVAIIGDYKGMVDQICNHYLKFLIIRPIL